jgi:hypothetical protein
MKNVDLYNVVVKLANKPLEKQIRHEREVNSCHLDEKGTANMYI